MFIYFVVAFALIFLHNRQSKISTKTQYVFLFFIAIFLCGGYMCGSDWRSYEMDYTAKEEVLVLEPGYYFLANAAQLNGENPAPYGK